MLVAEPPGSSLVIMCRILGFVDVMRTCSQWFMLLRGAVRCLGRTRAVFSSTINHGPSAIILVVFLSLHPASVSAEEKEYSCIVHVHSKMSSSGSYSLPELTEVARNYGVDAIFLTDNLTHNIQYGIAPLRHILWWGYSRDSVLTVGPEKYLDRIAAENRRQSDVLYVPGVEVCPRFYWTGSLFGGDPVCHDHQRNLIVLGVDDAGIFKRIPQACGYVWPKNAGWIIATRLLAILFVAACLAFLGLPKFLARRSPYSVRKIRRSLVRGFILPLLVIMIGVNVVASLIPAFRIYGEDKSAGHDQKVIDFLREHDVVHYWAHPEARDHHEFKYLGVSFEADTDPYPELLIETHGYTGFGGVYEDKNTLIEPGSGWDVVLNEYAKGKRQSPVWCFGEMLYHYEGQSGKKLGNVETMVWATEKSEKALLASLREGLFYARRNRNGQSLILESWRVGEGAGNLISVHVSSRVPGEDIVVRLIRNGIPIKRMSGRTPLKAAFEDGPSASGQKTYYRAIVSGSGSLKLITNPIFLDGSRRDSAQ